MKKQKIVKQVVACMVFCVFCFHSVLVFAETKAELNSQKSDLQNKKSEAQEEIKTVQSEISSTMKQVQSLSSEIDAYQAEIDELNLQITELEASIKKAEEEIAQKQKEYDEKMAAFEERLIATYENGETSFLDVLLSSKSITEFLSNYYLLSEITLHDTEYLEALEAQKKEIETAKAELETDKQKLETAKKSKEETAKSLEASRQAKNSQINQLSAEEKELQSIIDEYNSAIASLNSRINAIIAQENAKNPNSSYAGGSMAWPLPGYSTITAYYGWYYPWGVKTWHNAIDISGSNVYGKPIVAANSGTVVMSEYSSGGLGNMVMINHGGGIYTVYGHGSERKVSVGQYVERGQTIMLVGSTGNSTGPHLHFGVKVNGSYVNPQPYIM